MFKEMKRLSKREKRNARASIDVVVISLLFMSVFAVSGCTSDSGNTVNGDTGSFESNSASGSFQLEGTNNPDADELLMRFMRKMEHGGSSDISGGAASFRIEDDSSGTRLDFQRHRNAQEAVDMFDNYVKWDSEQYSFVPQVEGLENGSRFFESQISDGNKIVRLQMKDFVFAGYGPASMLDEVVDHLGLLELDQLPNDYLAVLYASARNIDIIKNTSSEGEIRTYHGSISNRISIYASVAPSDAVNTANFDNLIERIEFSLSHDDSYYREFGFEDNPGWSYIWSIADEATENDRGVLIEYVLHVFQGSVELSLAGPISERDSILEMFSELGFDISQ
jgi:hypothetical protein